MSWDFEKELKKAQKLDERNSVFNYQSALNKATELDSKFGNVNLQKYSQPINSAPASAGAAFTAPKADKSAVQADNYNKLMNLANGNNFAAKAAQRARAGELSSGRDFVMGSAPSSFGAERVDYGVKSIGQAAAGAVPMIGATASQAAKDLAANIQNPEWRAAAAKKIKGEILGEVDQFGINRGVSRETNDALKEVSQDTPVDPNSFGARMLKGARESQERALAGLNPTERLIGSSLISVGQNAAMLPTALINPAAPLVGMGAIASADKMYELSERGVGAGEAFTRGVVSGAIEAATEKIPLDNMLTMLKSASGREVIKNILRQMGTEAGEEAVSYIANYVADKAANDPQASFSPSELAQAAAAGAISGGIMGGAGTAIGTLRSGGAEKIYALTEQKLQENAPQTENTANSQTIGNMENVSEQQEQPLTQEERFAKGMRSGLVPSISAYKVNVRTRRALSNAANRLGVKITFDDTLNGENGIYDPRTGVIHIALDSADPIGVIATHEMTHRMKETSPELYENFKNIAFGIMKENGSFENVRNAVIESYGENAAIDDEILAHYTRNIVEDIGEFEKLVGVNRNLAQRIFDFFDQLIRKAGWDNNAQVALDNLFGDIGIGKLQRSREAWRVMLDKADAQARMSGAQQQSILVDPQNGADNAQVMKSKPLENEIAAMQSLGRKSVNDFTEYDLNATGKYAEKVWGEMGVKSPFFRAWFGDWRAYDKTPVIVANVKGDSRGIVKNNDTGWGINVSSKVFNESKAHRGPLNKPALPYLPYINDIVKKSVLLDSFTVNEPKSPNTMMMHSMYAIADIGNGPEVLKLYVEEINDPNNSDTLKRAYQLQNIEKATGMGVVGSEQAPSLIASIPVAINTVSDLFNAVKQRDANFNPKPVSPKLLNEDGTPKVMYHQTENDFTVFDVGHEGSGSGDSGTPYGVFMKPNSNDIGLRGKKQMPIYGRMANPLEIESRTELEMVLRENAQYAGILNEISRVNSEYRVKVKEAADNLKSYITNWRKENPHRSTQELYQDEEFERAFDEEDRLSDEWTAKIDRLSAQAKAFATDHLKQSGYDGVILKNDDGSFGRKTEANIVLNPNQVKSATDNIGTFSRYNDDIRYSKPLASLKRQFEPHEQPINTRRELGGSAINRIGEAGAFDNVKTLLLTAENERENREKQKEKTATIATPADMKRGRKNIEDAISGFTRKIVDSGERVDKIAKAVGDDVLYPLYNNARQARSAAMNNIGVAQTDLQGRKVGKSVADIVTPIKAKGERYWEAFQQYVYHLHNIDSMTLETRGANILYNELQNLVEQNPILANIEIADEKTLKEIKNSPQYKAVFNEWQKIYARMKGIKNKPVFGRKITAEDSQSIVSTLEMAYPEIAKEAQQIFDYYKNMMRDNVSAGLISEKERQTLEMLYPHYVPVMTNSPRVSISSKDNVARVEDVHKARTANERMLLPIDEAMARKTLSSIAAQKRNLFGIRLLEHALTDLDKTGRDVVSISDSDLPYDIDAEEAPDLSNKFTVWVDGETVDMAVSPELMEGVRAIMPKPSDKNYAAELVAGTMNLFKKSVTSHNPFFAVTNALKDFQDAMFYTKQNPAKFAANYKKAYEEIATGGELWELYRAMGGVGNSYFNYGEGVELPNYRGIKKLGAKIEGINLMVEQAPRLAEFIDIVEKGGRGYENLQKALLAAADITVNFGRSGEWGKNLNKYAVAFFNPAVQGTSKWKRALLSKNGKRAAALMITKAALLSMLPTLFNEWWWYDDEEYQMLTDSVKDNYYLFKMSNGIWLRIPKGRALMPLANLASRTYRMARGDEKAWEGYLQSTLGAIAPNNPFTDNIIMPLYEAQLFNPKSAGKTWYGGDIESMAMQNLEPRDRTDEYTSDIANIVGKTLNVSPKKIHHVLDSYTGVWGDMLLPTTAPGVTGAWPLIDRFYTDVTFKNRLASDYYSALDEVTQQKNSKPTPAAYAQYNALNDFEKDISDANKRIKNLQNSDMSRFKKADAVKEARKELNEIYREALEEAQAAKEKAEEEFKAIPPEAFERAVRAADSATGTKEIKNGKERTEPLSLARNQKAAIDKATPELNRRQREAIYMMLGINEKVW